MCFDEENEETFKAYDLSQLEKEALLQLQLYLHHQAVFPLNEYLEITETQFYFLADKLNPFFSSAFEEEPCKEYTVEIQLAITLKYLATNEFCLPNNLGMLALQKVMVSMVYQMCEWMYKLLKEEFLSLPKNLTEWHAVANKFRYIHNMPYCIGVLAMHRLASSQIPIRFSRKCSPLIFTTIVDADNNFLYVDVSRSRAMEWDAFFEASDIKKIIENKKHEFPEGIYGNQANICNLRFFVGDNSLPNTTYLLSELHNPGPIWNGKHFIYTQCPPKSIEFNFCQAMSRINAHTKQTLHALQSVFPPVADLWCLDGSKSRKVLLGSVLLYNYLRSTNPLNRTRSDILARAAPPALTSLIEPQMSFNRLLKQKSDKHEGLTTRNRIIIYMAIRRLCQQPHGRIFYPENGLQIQTCNGI